MYHPSHRIERRLRHCLGKRGVRVYGEIDFLDGVFVLSSDGQLVDDLRGVSADDMRAENLTVFLVPDDLHESLRLTRRPGPAVGAEVKTTDLVIQLLLLRLLLCQSDARHLW